MRTAGLSSGIDKDRADYTVFCGEWNIGRIYERNGFPDEVRFFCAIMECPVCLAEVLDQSGARWSQPARLATAP
jgi:hypothetical protein